MRPSALIGDCRVQPNQEKNGGEESGCQSTLEIDVIDSSILIGCFMHDLTFLDP